MPLKSWLSRTASFCLVAGALALPVAASATSLHTTGWIAPPPDSFTVHRGATSQGVQAGGFTGIWDITTAIEFWCFDLDHVFSLGGTYDYTASLLSGGLATSLAQLFQEAGSVAGSPHNSAALQLAIWNLLYDGDNTVSGGSFYATGNATAIAQANTWLMNIGNFTGAGYSITYLHNNNNPMAQNFITVANIPRQQVPEPPMLPLVLAALGAVALVQRRRVQSRGE
jgi:hypothetical protein